MHNTDDNRPFTIRIYTKKAVEENGPESDTELNKSKRIKKEAKAKAMKENGRSEHRSEQRSNLPSVNPAPVVHNNYYYGSCNNNNNNSGRGEFSGNSYNSTGGLNDWNEKK